MRLTKTISNKLKDPIQIIRGNNRELLDAFLKENPNSIHQLHGSITMLGTATHWDRREVFLRLLEEPNLNFNQKDSFGNTALHYAAMLKDSFCFNLLLEKQGIEGTIIENKAGKTPLKIALELNHRKMIDSLLEILQKEKHETEDQHDQKNPVLLSFNKNKSKLIVETTDDKTVFEFDLDEEDNRPERNNNLNNSPPRQLVSK